MLNKFNNKREKGLLEQKNKNPFAFLEGTPELDLKRIHNSLTQIWVIQAQLEQSISTNQINSIGRFANELKQVITNCAQEIDEEYNKLLQIVHKFQDRIGKDGANHPNYESDDEFKHTENYMSFQEDEFQSVCTELYDERAQIPLTHKRTLQRQETTANQKPIPVILDTLRLSQPIKYKNLISAEAFKNMSLGTEPTRQQLPVFKDPNEQTRLFSVIRDMVGKDLTKITFPVTFNEPLSMLQNLCESLEYSELLDQADQIQTSPERLAYVMIFSVSGLAASINRVKKPFNPILGETYEFQNEKFRYLSEQVSHHPPISVGFAENDHFEFLADSNVKTSFWGKSIEVIPQGWVHIKLKSKKDSISFQRCKSAFKNLIIGQQYLDHYGEMQFRNDTTGDTGVLKLTEKGWNGGGAYQLSGFVKNKAGQQCCTIQGKWDSSIELTTSNKQTTKVWTRSPLPQKHEQQYFFTQFAIQLNHLHKQLFKVLPATDSRLRPDQRALEYGNVELAAVEKSRLEEKQRAAKKLHHGSVYKPRWFSVSDGNVYSYNGEYWQARDSEEFHTKGADIF